MPPKKKNVRRTRTQEAIPCASPCTPESEDENIVASTCVAEAEAGDIVASTCVAEAGDIVASTCVAEAGDIVASTCVAEASRPSSLTLSYWVYKPPNGVYMDVRRDACMEPRVPFSRIEPNEKFVATEECWNPAQGVNFLRLRHTEGWVLESRPDIGRLCERCEPFEISTVEEHLQKSVFEVVDADEVNDDDVCEFVDVDNPPIVDVDVAMPKASAASASLQATSSKTSSASSKGKVLLPTPKASASLQATSSKTSSASSKDPASGLATKEAPPMKRAHTTHSTEEQLDDDLAEVSKSLDEVAKLQEELRAQLRNNELQKEAEQLMDSMMRSVESKTCNEFADERINADAGMWAEYKDSNGMSPLHYAARLCHKTWLEKLVAAAPHMAAASTYAWKTPSGWLPIHCLADTPKVKGEAAERNFADMVRILLSYMSAEDMAMRTTKGNNFMHILMSRGHNEALKAAAAHMVSVLGREVTRDTVLNAKNNAGKGCVDVGLQSRNLAGVHLIENETYGGKALTARPEYLYHGSRHKDAGGTVANNWRSDYKWNRHNTDSWT